MKSLFNIKLTNRIFLSLDVNFSYNKEEGFDFNLYILPSINIEKNSNDIVKCSHKTYKFYGWTKINFNFLLFNLCISINNNVKL